MTPEHLLLHWLSTRLASPALEWLNAQLTAVRGADRDADLYLAFSLAPRKTGKADLRLSADELAAARASRPGWDPSDLSVDQAARLVLLLATQAPADRFAHRLEQLCVTADVAELVLLYRGLPLYPEPERYRFRAAEGVRTNMKAVFEAVAHRNPYPSEQLPGDAWNQMVLKALFVESPLHPIAGLDRRANPRLARMLSDYAHERWSAGRPVSHELWRCVGPFAEGDLVDDLARVLAKGSPPEKHAAALALSASPDPNAATLLRAAPELSAAVAAGTLSWQSLAAA